MTTRRPHAGAPTTPEGLHTAQLPPTNPQSGPPSHLPSYPSESLSYGGPGYHAQQSGGRGGSGMGSQELDFQETVLLHLGFVKKGLLEANNFEQVLDALATSKTLQASLVKNTVLQSVLLLSALLFEHVLYPSVRGSSTLRHFFQIFWLWPITVASFLVSGVGNLRPSTLTSSSSTSSSSNLSTSVTHHARTLSTFISHQQAGGGGGGGGVVDYRGLTARVLEESYRALVLGNYLVVVHGLAGLPVPWVGSWLAFAYAAMINSYYLWESRWTEQGLTLKDRVKSLEQRFTYHFGFGLTITLCCFWHPSFFVNLALFSLLYPLFQICASSPSSRPVPLSSRYPLSSSDPTASGSANHAKGIDDPRSTLRANPFFPTRVPLLSPAAALHAVIVRVFSPSSGAGRAATRIRSSRRKDREMEEMEGGGGPDEHYPSSSASFEPGPAGPFGAFGGGGGAVGGHSSPPPTMGMYGTTYGNGAQTLFDAPPIEGETPLPAEAHPPRASVSNGSAVPPPPPPTVRKRAKGD